jgi:hypothetical protein
MKAGLSCHPIGRPAALRWALASLVLLSAALATPVRAQATAPAAASIYTCNTPDGRKLTSDRPIAECKGVEQRVLNRDGSLRRVVPPTPTADELAAREAEERRLAAVRQAQQDAIRRDRNLKYRYPDEAAHRRAREGALDVARAALRSAEQRIVELERERQPLLAETEFYVGREIPERLRQQLDANDVAVAAQRNAMVSHRAEIDRINRLYDTELARLRQLWAGAPLGTTTTSAPSVTVPVAADTRADKSDTPR